MSSQKQTYWNENLRYNCLILQYLQQNKTESYSQTAHAQFSSILLFAFRWKANSKELTFKLNKACYAIRTIKALVSTKALISIYFAYFHFLLMYAIIFWGNSTISKQIFKIQKRAIRIMAGKGRRESCRYLFNQFNILTFPAQYIFSLLVSAIENRDSFVLNNNVRGYNTCINFDFFLPSTHLSIVQRSVLHSGSRIFNSLPLFIKGHSENPCYFRKLLKTYLLEQSFYTLEEYQQHSTQ